MLLRKGTPVLVLIQSFGHHGLEVGPVDGYQSLRCRNLCCHKGDSKEKGNCTGHHLDGLADTNPCHS